MQLLHSILSLHCAIERSAAEHNQSPQQMRCMASAILRDGFSVPEPSQLHYYLESRGWREEPYPHSIRRVTRFTKMIGERLTTIAVPTDISALDYKRCVVNTADAISEIECLNPFQVWEDMQTRP